MSDNTKHLAKKCVKDAGAVPRAVRSRRSGRAAGCSGAIRRAPKCQFPARHHRPCRRHDDRRRARFDFLGV